MTEFLRLLPPDEARLLLLSTIAAPLPRIEVVATAEALARVTTEDIMAPHPLPEFNRSSVDGYAVRARDTFGASSSLPAYMRLAGEILMGTTAALTLDVSQCALIHTGGMLPSGADAVVMLENAQMVRSGGTSSAADGEVEVFKAVAPGENVIAVGEDVKNGQIVIRRGARLRPQDLGGLMALGITSVQVSAKPRVGLISSGDEIVDPHARPSPGQVRDVNASALSAVVSEAGGAPVFLGVARDQPGETEGLVKKALAECDMVLITAGSSASTRDLTAGAIAGIGAPGVLVHGVNIKPGKPTILGVCDGKAVIGLPGNPVSALVIAKLFVVPVIDRLLGFSEHKPRPKIAAQLAANLASEAGREDWWPVRLTVAPSNPEAWIAEPVFGRSNLIFNLVAADGLLRIPAEKNGLSAGTPVEVELF